MRKSVLFIPLIIYLIMLSCAKPGDPVGPSWTLPISKIPLLKADTVKVGEELESDNIKPDVNNLLHANFTETAEFYVDEQLNLIPDITVIQIPLTEVDQQLFEDPPEGLENLQFEQVNIVIRSLNVPFDFLVHFDFAATKKGEINSLSAEITIPEGDTSPHSVNIAELINMMPERISINGWTRILEDITITESAVYNLEYALDIPLRFSITDESTIEKTEELDLDQDARDAIKDNVISAGLEGKIINETPVSGTLEFYVGLTEVTATNLLFSLSLPRRGTQGLIDLSIDEPKLDNLVAANYFRVFVSIDSVLNGELKLTDHIIIKDIYLSGIGKIDLSETESD